MSLANLIKKGSLRGLAAATPATFATHDPFRPSTVATVAGVAAAKAPDTAANDPSPDPDRWCWPHSPAMNSAEIEVFLTRQSRLMYLGLNLDAAEKMADKLVFRDRDMDDRKVCFECCHLAPGLRCLNWRNTGIGVQQTNAKLSGAFVCQLQRCPGFTTATGEDANGL